MGFLFSFCKQMMSADLIMHCNYPLSHLQDSKRINSGRFLPRPHYQSLKRDKQQGVSKKKKKV